MLRGSSDSRPIAWCVIGVFAGLYIFYKGFLLLQRRHLILDTPVSKVRSASLGLVEVSGLAAGPYTIVAPISERECYFYRTVAWEWKQRGRSRQWVKVAAESRHVGFFVDDNTGKVLVDPSGAELDLHCDFKQEFCDGFFTLAKEAPPPVENFLFRHGVSTRNKVKVEEFCIKPKNALFVLGTLAENSEIALSPQPTSDLETGIEKASSFWLSLVSSSSSSSFSSSSSSFGLRGFAGLSAASSLDRQSEDERLAQAVFDSSTPVTKLMESRQVIRLSTADASAKTTEMTQQQKVAAALVKAGISNPAAWSAAGIGSSATPKGTNDVTHPNSIATDPKPESAGQVAEAAFEQRPRVVLKKGENSPTFFISWRSQRDVARSLGWKCTLMIWGGPSLTIFCLWLLHNMTHWF